MSSVPGSLPLGPVGRADALVADRRPGEGAAAGTVAERDEVPIAAGMSGEVHRAFGAAAAFANPKASLVLGKFVAKSKAE
ncbi:hypothetical protein [Aquabacterium humicola]|uniref:hypothetical protein n=1 Tax=Aquabacterium humicola TaxID=3237377 RepID=UPI002543420A|nr:hypothetical protein [Rubrivivax pictus]